jgi:DNA repair protein RadD
MKRELRPHQAKAIEMLRQSLGSGKRRPVLQAPTGFGKTLLAAAVVEGALAKKKRVIFTVPALSLVDQTVKAFWDDGVRDVGVIQGTNVMTDWSRPVQVASVQTLQRRPIAEADVVLIDECHRWFDFYAKWMTDPAWQSKPFIGLSATPWTRGLGQYFDDLIIAATPQDLISEGYLSPFRVFAPSHPDLTGVRTVAGDYDQGDLSGVMSDAPLVADIVDTWLQRAENRSTFCFAVDRAHAKHLQAKFAEAGVSTGYIDAYTPISERSEIERKFHDGNIRVVCNVGCLTTGIDWDVRCIVLARPTKSEILFVQIIGRGL